MRRYLAILLFLIVSVVATERPSAVSSNNCKSVTSPQPDVNCTVYCHAMNYTGSTILTPQSGVNCTKKPCNQLTADELAAIPNGGDYCDGTLPCYSFSETQLAKVKYLSASSQCALHKCTDTDIANITSQPSNYITAYKQMLANYTKTTIADISLSTVCIAQPSDPIPAVCDLTKMTQAQCDAIYNAKPSSSDYNPSSVDIASLKMSNPSPNEVPATLLNSEDPSNLCVNFSSLNDSSINPHVEGTNSLLGIYAPGLCSVSKLGTRGVGEAYLCGNGSVCTEGAVQDGPDSRSYIGDGPATYIKSAATVKYQSAADLTDPEVTIAACLRFKNTGANDVCGARECRYACIFGGCTQWCGFDVCKNLTAKSSLGCSNAVLDSAGATTDFNNSIPASCQSVIDDYLRLRLRIFGNHACVFLDVKGCLSYSGTDFWIGNNNSKITIKDNQGTANEKTWEINDGNSNHDVGLAAAWRAYKLIKYKPNQDCAKIALPLGPPGFYDIATVSNTPMMFGPALQIYQDTNGVLLNKLGTNLITNLADSAKNVDFYQPKIVVQFGTCGAECLHEIAITDRNATTSSVITVTGKLDNQAYTTQAYIKKEESNSGDYSGGEKPILCLYQQISSAGTIGDIKITCVPRNLPLISERVISTSRVMSSDDYNNGQIKLTLKARDNQQTSAMTYTNEGISVPYLQDKQCANAFGSGGAKNYTVCAKEDQCSPIEHQCIDYRVALYAEQNDASKRNSLIIAGLMLSLEECNNIARQCANLKGQNINGSPILDSNGNAKYPNAYGWFHQICLTSGFNNQIKNVIAYKTIDNIISKCLVGNVLNNANCTKGGDGKNCLCIESDSILNLDPMVFQTRPATLREAGLCIDIPTKPTCSPVTYDFVSDEDEAIKDAQSLGKTNLADIFYGHKNRTSNTAQGNANWPYAVAGMNNVQGKCAGYWKYATNPITGAPLSPTANCVANGNGVGVFGQPLNLAGTNLSTACVRYSCNIILQTNTDYTKIENGVDDGGRSNGYAEWPATTSSDTALDIKARRCIVGYRPYNKYTSLINGVPYGAGLPHRYCDQKGNWYSLRDKYNSPGDSIANTNYCEPIYCPAITTADINPNPYFLSSAGKYNGFDKNFGATWSATRVGEEAVGKCDEANGYVGGNQPPKRLCIMDPLDPLLNDAVWDELKDPNTKCARSYCSPDSTTEWVNAGVTVSCNWPKTGSGNFAVCASSGISTSLYSQSNSNTSKYYIKRYCSDGIMQRNNVSKTSGSWFNPEPQCYGDGTSTTLGGEELYGIIHYNSASLGEVVNNQICFSGFATPISTYTCIFGAYDYISPDCTGCAFINASQKSCSCLAPSLNCTFTTPSDSINSTCMIAASDRAWGGAPYAGKLYWQTNNNASCVQNCPLSAIGDIFPTTRAGSGYVEGSCQSGFVTQNGLPPKRYCNSTGSWTSINSCVAYCPRTSDSTLGYDIPSAFTGNMSSGTCLSGFDRLAGSSVPSMRCITQNGGATWDMGNLNNTCQKICPNYYGTGGSISSGIGTKAGSCSATWVGSISGTCNNGTWNVSNTCQPPCAIPVVWSSFEDKQMFIIPRGQTLSVYPPVVNDLKITGTCYSDGSWGLYIGDGASWLGATHPNSYWAAQKTCGWTYGNFNAPCNGVDYGE